MPGLSGMHVPFGNAATHYYDIAVIQAATHQMVAVKIAKPERYFRNALQHTALQGVHK